jgi:hypothetical protein
MINDALRDAKDTTPSTTLESDGMNGNRTLSHPEALEVSWFSKSHANQQGMFCILLLLELS